MAKPVFFWNVIRQLFFGALALLIAFLFWLFSIFFLFLNLFIAWHRLWRGAGLMNLMLLRFIMRIRNLYDSYKLPTSPADPDPRAIRWNPRYRYERSADGKFNDLDDPLMGSEGRRFGRNFPLTRLKVDKSNLLEPNPREISRKLLTRDRFKPATSLNLLAAAWIQFQVHGWFNHRRSKKEFLPDISLEKDDTWPEPVAARNSAMKIRISEHDSTRPDTHDPPTFRNTETHWWDASQLYGSNRKKQDELRENNGRGAKLQMMKITLGDNTEEVRLPQFDDPDLPGVDLTGFNDNWWVGLSMLHTLFALEHNTICDRLRQAYPEWDDERLFQTARLINAALMAKIHTVEWTPAILGHPAVVIGMHANWWGLLTERITKNLGRIKILKGIQEEITGIPGSEKDHHAAPYQLTEEFVSVYRMHPLIPDDYRFYSAKSDEFLEEATFTEIQGNGTRPVMQRISIEDLFYSFGVTHPGQITLHNFPRSLQHFTRVKDDGKLVNEILDLATVDIIRDRERAVPRYNAFRKLLLMLPIISYRKLVGLPFIPWFSGFTRREREERKNWVKELKTLYPKKKALDLMIGFLAEKCPKGFGFSDTAFRIFILMASRRLKSDRFFTDDYKPEVYSELGMRWIDENNFKSVLKRHYPALAASIAEVDNPFAPWTRAESPPREPLPMTNVFSVLPIIGGAIFGSVVGLIVGGIPRFWLGSSIAFIGVLKWAALGASVATLCLAFFYLLNDWIAREFSPRGRAAIAALAAVTGGFIGSLWASDGWTTYEAFLDGLGTLRAAIGALIGGIIGVAVVKVVHHERRAAREESKPDRPIWRVLDPIIRVIVAAVPGAIAGWAVGVIFYLVRVLIAAGFGAAVVDAFQVTENRWWALVGALVGFADRGGVGLLIGGVIGWVAGTIYGLCWCFGPLVIGSLFAPAGWWGAAIGAIGLAILSLLSWSWEWRIRRGFWNFLGLLKFHFAKPKTIPRPRKDRDKIGVAPLGEVIPAIPISVIKTASNIPQDESGWLETLAFKIQVWLYQAFSPMQPELPSINGDPEEALDQAYGGLHRRMFDPPDFPPEYEGSPDLGSLAVRGPYSIYLQRVKDVKDEKHEWYEWNFKDLEQYGHHKGLYNLGVRVLFQVDSPSKRLREYEIETPDLGKSKPGDANWPLAKKLALCAATNHISLVRHFNWVHLASCAHLAIATRNSFPGNEPLCRLLWPHIYRTQQSNEMVTRGLMVRGGDFETIFSFRYDGMCRLFEDTYQQFDFLVNDPVKDAERRHVRGQSLDFKTPTQENLEDLFEVFRRHAERYLLIYYRSDGTIQDEESLNLPARGNRVLSQDQHVDQWLKDLNRLIPNGIPVKPGNVTQVDLARLIANFIYLVTVQHEMLGSFLWNYQLWTHRQPVRLYQDGRREPLDVYQRLINANFILNVRRTELVKDYSYMALDEPGRDAFRQFERELCELDQQMKHDPWAIWKIYPKTLKANINA